MNLHGLVPIVMFVCIAYVLKAVIDALTRLKLLRAGGSDELLRTIVQSEESQRRHASLRSGITFVALAIAFGGIQIADWHDITPGVIAWIAGAMGVANLAFFAISRRLG